MSITIEDTGNTVKWTDTVKDKQVIFNKNEILTTFNVRAGKNEFQIEDSNYQEEFFYEQVTVPSSTSPDDLLDQLEAFIPDPTPRVLAYGGLQAENENAAVSTPTQSVYVLYNNFEANFPALNTTPDETAGTITVDVAGEYFIQFSGDCDGTLNEVFQWELHNNGLRTVISARVEVTGSEVGVSAGNTIALAAGDVISLRVRCTTAAATIARGRDMNMSVHKIN